MNLSILIENVHVVDCVSVCVKQETDGGKTKKDSEERRTWSTEEVTLKTVQYIWLRF